MSKCPNPGIRTVDRLITETFCVPPGRLFGFSYPNCRNLLVPRVKRGSSNCVPTEGTIGTEDFKLNCQSEVLMLTCVVQPQSRPRVQNPALPPSGPLTPLSRSSFTLRQNPGKFSSSPPTLLLAALPFHSYCEGCTNYKSYRGKTIRISKANGTDRQQNWGKQQLIQQC
jgi:hypothetical protein